MKNISIAVDGPSSSGKSTIAKAVAKALKIEYIDSGAMYRYVAYFCEQNDIDIDNEALIVSKIKDLNFSFKDQQLYVNNQLIQNEIRTPHIASLASKIATYVSVRQLLVEKQQALAKTCSVIMDGRDVATHILPNADFKFYVTASVEVRAKRRYDEYLSKGIQSDLQELIKEQEQRDYKDMNREYAPLVQTKDAILIDSTNLSVKMMVDQMIDIIRKEH